MKVLISNDDGIDAPGILALADSVAKVADDYCVVAPDRNRSGASNSLTLASPIRAAKRSPNWISVQGTPTDCVHMALTGLLEDTPDIVISGVNAGANLGDDVWYSGTVAAAMEGRFMSLPSIAVSLCGEDHFNLTHFDTAARVATELAQRLLHNPLGHATMLNVNVPDVPYERLKGFEITRLGYRHQADPIIKETDPRGLPIYWVGPAGQEADAGEGTDFWAVRQRRVSITPIRVDLTQYEVFDHLSQWVNKPGPEGLDPMAFTRKS